MLVCWIAIQRLSVCCVVSAFPLERPPRPSSTPDPACRLPIDSELGADYFLSILEIIIDRSVTKEGHRTGVRSTHGCTFTACMVLFRHPRLQTWMQIFDSTVARIHARERSRRPLSPASVSASTKEGSAFMGVVVIVLPVKGEERRSRGEAAGAHPVGAAGFATTGTASFGLGTVAILAVGSTGASAAGTVSLADSGSSPSTVAGSG